jgi:hypothetical protein
VTAQGPLLYLTQPTTMLWVSLMFRVPITWPGLAGLAISGGGVWLVLHSQALALRTADASVPMRT